VTGGKPIAIWSHTISGESAVGPLVAFYDIPEGKEEVPLYSSVPNTTPDIIDSKSYFGIGSTFLFVVLTDQYSLLI
jgi:hypothetical protein